MPLLRADAPVPERPVVIAIYGEPGVRKTSIAQTANEPLTIDFDRGIARSWGRKDAIVVDDWDELMKFERQGFDGKYFKDYKTIIIDTAKAALDDFLMIYVCKHDAALLRNKLKAYGAIGDEFKRFVNARRNEGCDIIIVAHAKKDEDTKQRIPDVTGQSYNLILRIADQVGFTSSKNNEATIQWTPTDTTVGKNTANLPEATIPDKSDPLFRTFMTDIIAKVKSSLVQMSEAQKEAEQKSEKFQKEIDAAKTPEDLTMILPSVNALPKAVSAALRKLIGDKAKKNNWVWDQDAKKFVNPQAEADSEKEPVTEDINEFN